MKPVIILISCALVALLAFTYISNKDSSLEINGNQHSTSTESTATSSSAESQFSATASTTQKQNTQLSSSKHTMNITLHTNKGDITIELFTDRVPNTTANFKKLAEAGFYNGVKFHRVIKGFMIQGGDPLTKDDTLVDRWGTGGPGYTFNDEITPDNKNNAGTISMANAGPNTNGSQFFINVKDNNFLDTKHTVFGKVVAGMDVVTEIDNTPTGIQDRPVSPVIIEKISF